MREQWMTFWVEWQASLLHKLITNYGGGPTRVAYRMGIWPSHVQKIQHGTLLNPSLKTMSKFADAFCRPVIVFPPKWTKQRKYEWLAETYNSCIGDEHEES